MDGAPFRAATTLPSWARVLSPAVEDRPLVPPPPSRFARDPSAARSSRPIRTDAPARERGRRLLNRRAARAGFSWAALGHHHHSTSSPTEPARRAAYSVRRPARGLDEAGPGLLKVTLSAGRPSAWKRCRRRATLFDLMGCERAGGCGDPRESRRRLRDEGSLRRTWCADADGVQPTAHAHGRSGALGIARLTLVVATPRIRPREGTSSVPSAEGASMRTWRRAPPRRRRDPARVTSRSARRDALAGRAVRPPEPERG